MRQDNRTGRVSCRTLVDVRLEQLLENPNQQPVAAYDERTDQWATVYGGGVVLIVYVVSVSLSG
jgi:hypothetical protein